uniref:Uncharacterized protein n=1 Tax=Anopheles atroparvus TaxID=41427 RepID=A0A182J4J2_ANOAO
MIESHKSDLLAKLERSLLTLKSSVTSEFAKVAKQLVRNSDNLTTPPRHTSALPVTPHNRTPAPPLANQTAPLQLTHTASNTATVCQHIAHAPSVPAVAVAPSRTPTPPLANHTASAQRTHTASNSATVHRHIAHAPSVPAVPAVAAAPSPHHCCTLALVARQPPCDRPPSAKTEYGCTCQG